MREKICCKVTYFLMEKSNFALRNEKNSMRPVFLIGFMGCGKTTLGVELARAMHCRFVDLDDYIELLHGATVSELFTSRGEAWFREQEQEALRSVAAGNDVVVACGGGTPCGPGAMELMNERGLTVWLTTSAQRIAARLCLPEQKAKRPLLAGKSDEEMLAYVEQALSARTPFYAQARLHFDSTDIETAAATRATARRLSAAIHAAPATP